MAMKTSIEIDAGTRTFASGLLPELIAALRRCRQGDLLAVIGGERTSAPTSRLGLKGLTQPVVAFNVPIASSGNVVDI
jgi:hypothetical protein